MVSETSALSGDDENVVNRSAAKKINRGKVPRKIVKAEREKSKRDHMNVLFLDLGKVIVHSAESDNQNNGKASILKDTISLVRVLLTQINSLKQENSSLLSESHYVTAERNELKEENSALEEQIGKLQSEIEKRVQFQSSWNSSLSVSHPTAVDQSCSAPVPSSLFLLPLHHDPQAHAMPDITEAVPKTSSKVSRPRARYPSQSDSWPSHILGRQFQVTESAERSCTSTSCISSSG